MAKKKNSSPFKNPLLPLGIGVAVILLGILYVHSTSVSQAPTTTSTISSNSAKKIPFDFGSQTLMVDNQPLVFTNGSYTGKGSDDNHTAHIENRTLSADELKAAAIMIDNPGGSGTFYYVVGGSLVNGAEKYSEPVLLGDRVTIQSLSVSDDGIIEVAYLDRPATAAMSAEPTRPVTKKFAFENVGNLIEVLH